METGGILVGSYTVDGYRGAHVGEVLGPPKGSRATQNWFPEESYRAAREALRRRWSAQTALPRENGTSILKV